MSNLPPIHFPPPKNKKQAGQQNAFRSYINAHPALRPWAQQLYKSATNYGLDPVYFASLVNFESGGKANAKSGAGAYGLAQIHVPTWLGKTDPRTGQKITQADINNPTWNLGFGAYLFSQALHKYGSYQAAYRQGYNPATRVLGRSGICRRAMSLRGRRSRRRTRRHALWRRATQGRISRTRS
jgi:soluble lytic murein transglycosylase-like protein